MIIVNENINIGTYSQLIAFLKVKAKGYVPKKAKVLEGHQLLEFMKNAPNSSFLMHKVVLVMGIFGGLRRDEMVKMTINQIEDRGSVLIIKVPETKTGTSKSFTIIEEQEIDALSLVRQYMALRPPKISEPRFFLTYRNNKCIAMPVGKNTLGSIPSIIASYLKLENPKRYTGHCLRRTSATLLVDGGASLETLKRHGGWKSSTVAEGYIEESTSSKNRIAKMIASSVVEKENVPTSGPLMLQSNEQCARRTGENLSVQSQNLGLGSNCFSGRFENCNFYFSKNSD